MTPDRFYELEAWAEIERLQTANEYAFNELTAARADIERLTAALQMIIDDTRDDWVKNVARRALEPKP